MSIDELLALARQLGVERGDAQAWLAHHLGRDRAWLLSHGEVEVPAGAAAIQQLAAGTPLAHLTGEQAFHGLVLRVSPATLIPRPDTETLVDWAIELIDGAHRVADLGTGSGAIALALKRACPAAQITATDRSPEALAVARENGARLGLSVDWRLGEWYAPLCDERFDLIVSNPPYIAGDDPHLPALSHEPRGALTPEGDGLADLRCLVAGATAHLEHGGWLLLEHGWDQADAVRAMLVAAGFEAVASRRDLGGRERASGGRRGD